ncbi:MAG TPA: hypothetical protein PLY87_10465 [Planctomycetaceae bacterium]|nr:hypothetical protein [Planctomycetaceae bacterium]HQZ65490.1 hypothetical protein [Planctomycetaceae bacterium]HRA88290.1 hypothetical protein [Planctomycetaceae bacterium]
MRQTAAVVTGLVLFAGGFLCGHLEPVLPTMLNAQVDEPAVLSTDALIVYQKARKAVSDLNDTFIAAGFSTNATTDVNYFSVSVGGIDVLRDLEEGRGVDPETFAALYAFEDQELGATGQKERVFKRFGVDISQHLDSDDHGRVRYKKKVVQMYSTERLNQLFNRRDQLQILSSNK